MQAQSGEAKPLASCGNNSLAGCVDFTAKAFMPKCWHWKESLQVRSFEHAHCNKAKPSEMHKEQAIASMSVICQQHRLATAGCPWLKGQLWQGMWRGPWHRPVQQHDDGRGLGAALGAEVKQLALLAGGQVVQRGRQLLAHLAAALVPAVGQQLNVATSAPCLTGPTCTSRPPKLDVAHSPVDMQRSTTCCPDAPQPAKAGGYEHCASNHISDHRAHLLMIAANDQSVGCFLSTGQPLSQPSQAGPERPPDREAPPHGEHERGDALRDPRHRVRAARMRTAASPSARFPLRWARIAAGARHAL